MTTATVEIGQVGKWGGQTFRVVAIKGRKVTVVETTHGFQRVVSPDDFLPPTVDHTFGSEYDDGEDDE